MTQTQPDTDAMSDRLADEIVLAALGRLRDLLGTDTLTEALTDDDTYRALDETGRDTVWEGVWERLGDAAAEYRRRDQVLTEAAELVRSQGADCCAGEHVEFHANLLLAARATQES